MANISKVLLLIDNSREFNRGVLRGITKYSNVYGPWIFVKEAPSYLDAKPVMNRFSNLTKENIDGVMLVNYPTGEEYVEKFVEAGIPVVAKGLRKTIGSTVNIICDNREIGKMGAVHCLERGFHNFAFFGLPEFYWSDQREEGFRKKIEEAGHKVNILDLEIIKKHANERKEDYRKRIEEAGYELDRLDLEVMNKHFGQAHREAISAWLKSLPKPVALMTCNDDAGECILELCQLGEIKVPEQVAVLGVDDDGLVCGLCHPPMSSVAIDTETAGFQAAKSLHMLMSGQQVKDQLIVCKPKYVTTRLSTDITAIDDEHVASAVRFIRMNCERIITVTDVSNAVHLSRRSLEMRFRKAFKNRTINQEILYVRMTQVARALLETDTTVSQLAMRMGYSDAAHFSRNFRNVMGLSPVNYRKMHRACD